MVLSPLCRRRSQMTVWLAALALSSLAMSVSQAAALAERHEAKAAQIGRFIPITLPITAQTAARARRAV
ncbi:MAG: hypothetical protein ABFC96_07135, partial [Thermoguttaceae bacterium]